jgi:radial spoke head protein 9
MSVLNAQHLSVAGRSLTAAESTALQCSLPLLSQRYRGTPVTLWGKISGIKADYWVAQAFPSGDFGCAASFYSTDGGSTWTLLADLTEEQAALCEALRGPYQGVPTYEYKARQDLPAETDEAAVTMPPQDDALKGAMADIAAARAEMDDANNGSDGDEEAEDGAEEAGVSDGDGDDDGEDNTVAVPPPRKRGPKFRIVSVTEAMRVAHFVQLHDVDCRLAVRGMYVLQDGEREGVRNGTFGGQPLHHAKKPSCYLKMAVLGKEERNRVLYGPTYNPHTDYLMPITDDAPAGVWSVKYDATANVVSVRNLFYEGSLFWYRPGTLECGQLYYGTGERNFDVCFML